MRWSTFVDTLTGVAQSVGDIRAAWLGSPRVGERHSRSRNHPIGLEVVCFHVIKVST